MAAKIGTKLTGVSDIDCITGASGIASRAAPRTRGLMVWAAATAEFMRVEGDGAVRVDTSEKLLGASTVAGNDLARAVFDDVYGKADALGGHFGRWWFGGSWGLCGLWGRKDAGQDAGERRLYSGRLALLRHGARGYS
jgi:hypothetical protein